MKDIAVKIEKLEQDCLREVEKNERMVNLIDKTHRWAFIIGCILVLLGVFTQHFLYTVSLAIFIMLISAGLLLYKSHKKLIESVEVYLWLALRCSALTQNIISLNADTNRLLSIRRINIEFDDLTSDYLSYRQNGTSSGLETFFNERYERKRYSAMFKNKYNKHEIKQVM